MALSPPTRTALSDVVADKLRSAILDGSLKPGEPLHESSLAKQLAVSRSPIREALIQLQRERLVTGRINHPSIVRRPAPAEIGEVYTIRAALEGIGARWAAERATPAIVRALRRKADELNKATRSEGSGDPRVAKLAVDFHAAISEIGGSAQLEPLLESMHNQIKLVMTAGLASLSERRAEEIHAEHLAIIDAIAERDGDTAERLAAEHVRGARERLTHANVAKARPND